MYLSRVLERETLHPSSRPTARPNDPAVQPGDEPDVEPAVPDAFKNRGGAFFMQTQLRLLTLRSKKRR